MRVAIDVSALATGPHSGTAVYLRRLVEALAKLPDGPELHVLYNGARGPGEELARSVAGKSRFSSAPHTWKGLPGPIFNRPYPKQLIAAAHEADVLHVGEFVYPPARAGQGVVATVHDVTTRLFPQWHNIWNRMVHRRRLRWISANATRVIIDAEATRRDTAGELGLPPDRLDVIPLARGTARADGGDPAALRRRLGIGEDPYVLFVGTLEPRKNLVRLVEAVRALPPDLTRVRLVLGGSWGWHAGALREALRAAGARVIVTGPLDGPSLESLYAGALVFAYPSLYEGFGLPLLEAMAAGAPVVTSRGGTLEEIAGGAAALVDPTDAGDIGRTLERLIRDDRERGRLREAGRRREREFSWEKTARATAEVYARAAREAGSL